MVRQSKLRKENKQSLFIIHEGLNKTKHYSLILISIEKYSQESGRDVRIKPILDCYKTPITQSLKGGLPARQCLFKSLHKKLGYSFVWAIEEGSGSPREYKENYAFISILEC